ncbi:MAG: hypothetical protein IJY92_05830 [Alphaproteobacteria bacterium]|nr:hypothetical protein [Alphaproteobacteria bacterium]
MKTSKDLVSLFKKDRSFFIEKLQKYYNENKTFEIDGIQYPLVEKIKSSGQIALALHEHENALEVFKKLLKKEGIVLKERKITSQKSKMIMDNSHQKD